jgi:hypothetical protein
VGDGLSTAICNYQDCVGSVLAECDCDCRLKACQEHAKQHHEKIKCDEGYKMCKTCPVKECDTEFFPCWAAAKTHEQQDVCLDAWYKCARCTCKFDICNKHAQKYHEVNRCKSSLDICRDCETSECDAAAEICHARAKTHAETHQCVEDWRKCGQCMCRFKECLKTTDPDLCNKGLVLCKTCVTKPCDGPLFTCMKSAKTKEERHKCLTAWYTCVEKDCKV